MNSQAVRAVTCRIFLLTAVFTAGRFGASAGSQGIVFEHGTARSVPHARSTGGNQPGTERGAAGDLRSCTVMVLAPHGYDVAIKGANGFTCLVERSWMSPFDSSEFWNPKMRGPICYNPPATRSILPFTVKTTELALARLSKAEINERIRAIVANKELPMPEPGAMSYMMSKGGYLGDSVGPWHPHLMFHIPKTDAASWGANLPSSPVELDTDHPRYRSRKPSSWCRSAIGRMEPQQPSPLSVSPELTTHAMPLRRHARCLWTCRGIESLIGRADHSGRFL